MTNKIDETLAYYKFQSNKLLKYINNNSNLSVDAIIEYGEELAILENKMTALEIAKEN